MTNRIAVGTPVNVTTKYAEHKGKELVVLADKGTGYGIGPKGNDPAKGHNGAEGWLYYSSDTVTVKETPQFKAGDKVRVIDNGYTLKDWIGVEGIIQPSTTSYTNRIKLTTSPNKDYPVGYVATVGNNLELIEEPAFTVKDIQKGDTIRRTRTYASGATEVREGKVTRIGKGYVTEESESFILAYDTDTDKEDVTLELLNRPEPEPVKEAWETAKKGDRLVVKASNGATRVLTKLKSGEWETLVITASGSSHIGYTRSDEDLKGQLTSKSYNADGKPQFVKA